MLVRLGHVFIIAALLAATGTHWALFQSVAWSTMLAGNLRTGSLGEAVERTFDGKHPCALCNQIADGKRSEKKADLPTAKKLEFISDQPVLVLNRPHLFRLLPAGVFPAHCFGQRPPVPPPRSIPA